MLFSPPFRHARILTLVLKIDDMGFGARLVSRRPAKLLRWVETLSGSKS